jgi:type II secretory pathway component GspD/PulD (secretin)
MRIYRRFTCFLSFLLLTSVVWAQEREIRFFPLANRPATATVEIVKTVLSPEGTVFADARLNRLIVKDRPEFLEKAKKLIEECDLPAPTVQIQLQSSAQLPMRENITGIRLGPRGVQPQFSSTTTNQQSNYKQTLMVMSGERASISLSQDNPVVLPYQNLAQRLGLMPAGIFIQSLSTGFAVEPMVLGGNPARIRLKITPWMSYASPQGPLRIDFAQASSSVEVLEGDTVSLGGVSSGTQLQQEVFGIFSGRREAALSQTVDFSVSAQVIDWGEK